jgi:DNA-binding Lrp family transcriptional regulator
MGLDKWDLKILNELEQDSRKTTSQISKTIGTSQQVVSYRIKQLLEKGIIQKFFTTMDLGSLGYMSYRVMIKLNEISLVEKNKFLNYLNKKGNVLWICECGGKWDLIVNILAKDPKQFNKLFSEILKEYEKIILSYDLLYTIAGINFGRRYLYNSKKEMNGYSFGIRYPTKVDKIDLKILKEISKNARANSLELEKKTRINYKTIIQRIKSLRKKEIITGFKPLIDLSKIGYTANKLILDVTKISEKEEKEFFNFLTSDKNIIGVLKFIGKWNYEIEFEVQDREKTWEIYRKIQSYLREKIKFIDMVPLFKEYGYNYFPESLFKEFKK